MPRGNAYGLRGIWPGEFRGWRDPDKQARKAEKQARKNGYYNNNYYYNDPIAVYSPQYRTYRPDRQSFVRTMIANFFAPQHQVYYSPAYRDYGYQQPYYSRYRTATYSQPYYSSASYAPAYYDSGYGYNNGNGYDPYNNNYGYDPYGDQGYYGGDSLKSSLLNIGLSMLQGFLGQGYEQGLVNGQYARRYDPNRFADTSVDPVYYSPYVSSFSDQRQVFDEGYRMGYEDAMRNRDPYNYNDYSQTDGVNLLTEFLSNTILSRA